MEPSRCFKSSNPEGFNSSGILLFFVNGTGQPWILLTPKFIRCNTCKPPRICCKQRTCLMLKSFRCNIYKNEGGWRILPNLELARSNLADSQTQSSCKNAMATGDGTSTTCPVGVRPPVAASILKTTMLLENWFSASRYLPLGSMAKCRGSLPPVGIPPAGTRGRLPGSMERIGMLSFPRLETSRNFPFGWPAASATSVRPENPGGSVVAIAVSLSVPFFASYPSDVAVELS